MLKDEKKKQFKSNFTIIIKEFDTFFCCCFLLFRDHYDNQIKNQKKK